MTPTVYLGWDSREWQAYAVAKASILRRTAGVEVKPLRLDDLHYRGILTRPVEKRDGRMWCPISQAPMATEFAISRFAVPFLQRQGWAAFMDCDIVCLADVRDLFALADDRYAVMVVKHGEIAGGGTKMDGQAQTAYPRKLWSSVVLWNCSHLANARLTLDALNTWPGRDLHAFRWLNDSEIGGLPDEWNHLVGMAPPDPAAKLLHFTSGGPWFPTWAGGPLDEVWHAERHDTAAEVV